MLGYKWLLKLFGFTSKYELISTQILVQHRMNNSDFQKSIDNNYSVFRNLHKSYSRIREYLEYDLSEYDNQYYKRQILQTSLKNNSETYFNMKIPVLESFEDPDMGIQCIVNYQKLPDSYYLFLSLYKEFPCTRVKLYPADWIQDMMVSNYDVLQSWVINMTNIHDLENIIMFIPICYAKHFKQNPEDDQYIMLVCFVNVVDSSLDDDFPFINDRYYTIKLNLDSLEDNDLHHNTLTNTLLNQTQLIKKGDETMLLPRNIATQLGSFDEKFGELIDIQVFNI